MDLPSPGTSIGMDVKKQDSARTLEVVSRTAEAENSIPAWAAIRGVLGALGEVLPSGTAGYLADNLPDAVGEAVGRHFPADDSVVHTNRAEFLAAVCDRCHCHPDAADAVTRAVTAAVAIVVPSGVIADVRHVLPADLLDLVPVS
jgi:uncharacterized protein (DUF2267 family)